MDIGSKEFQEYADKAKIPNSYRVWSNCMWKEAQKQALKSQQSKIEQLEQDVTDTEDALTGAINCINDMKCCGNCKNSTCLIMGNKCTLTTECFYLTGDENDPKSWEKDL